MGTRLHLHGLLKVRKRLHNFIFVPSQPSALQLVLLIPEGMDIVILPSLRRGPRSERTNTGEVRVVPNCYLACKLFCATPHPTTPVQWASSNPQFQFRQVTNCVPVKCSLIPGPCPPSFLLTFPLSLLFPPFSNILLSLLPFLLLPPFLRTLLFLPPLFLPPLRYTRSTSLLPCSTKSAITLQSWRCGTRHQARQQKMKYVQHTHI